MKTSLYTIITCCFLVSASCFKDNVTTTVQGTVTSTVSGSAVSGATVYLLEKDAGMFTGSGNAINTFSTAANGSYSFTFDRKKDKSYSVTVRHPKYYDESAISDHSVESSSKQTINLQLIPEAYAKIMINNVSGADGFELSYPCDFIQKCNQQGQANNLILGTFRCYGGNTLIQWTVIKNSNPIPGGDSTIYFTPFDTTLVKINY